MDTHGGKLLAALGGMFDALDRGQSVADYMRDDERSAGNVVVLPGSEPWLSLEDWDPSIVVSRRGKEIRLVALLARHPGQGALRRTVTGIIGAGLVPIIVEPSAEMRATVKRWRWKRRLIGSSFEDREEHWLPKDGTPPLSRDERAE